MGSLDTYAILWVEKKYIFSGSRKWMSVKNIVSERGKENLLQWDSKSDKHPIVLNADVWYQKDILGIYFVLSVTVDDCYQTYDIISVHCENIWHF